MATFSDIETVVGRLFGAAPRPEADAVEAVEQAPARLRLPVPRLLLDFYRRFGWSGPLGQAQDRLVGPERWRVQDGALVFCVENQGVFLWGIRKADLAQDDPPVQSAENKKPLAWGWDHDRLSDFFISLAFRQAVNGTRGGVARAFQVGDEVLSRLAGVWPEVRLGPNRWGDRYFEKDGRILYLGQGGYVTAVGCTLADLKQIARSTGLEWDSVESEDWDGDEEEPA